MRIWSHPVTGKLIYVDDFIRSYNQQHASQYKDKDSYLLEQHIANQVAEHGLIYHGQCY